MKDKQLNKEEQLFSDKLNELEFEYNAADWDAIQDRLPNGGSSSMIGAKGLLGIAAVAVILTGSVYYFNQNDQEIPSPVDKTQFVEKAEEKPYEESEVQVEKSTSEDQNIAQKPNSTEESNVLTSEEVDLDKNDVQDQDLNIVADKNEIKEEEAPIAEIKTEKNAESRISAAHDEINSLQVDLPNKVCSEDIPNLMKETSKLVPDPYYFHFTFEGNSNKEESKEATHLSAVVKNEKGEVVKVIDKKVEIVDLSNYSVDYTYNDNKDPYTDLQVELKAEDEIFTSFEWKSESGELLGVGKELNYSFKDQGIYDIELAAKTAEGCMVRTTKPVAVQNDFDPLAPNAFTPDNDGTNDVFIPVGFMNRDDRFKMEIFNLNGELVYKGTDSKEGWNGQLNNSGQMMPDGFYVWKVSISNDKGQHKSFAGNVQLMRNN